MSTIDQKGRNGNPTNGTTDTSGEMSCEEPAPAPDTPSELIVIPPEVIRAGDEALDAMDALLDMEPATDRSQVIPPDPLSALAIRLTDGALLLSLQDASPATDLSGRTVVSFLVLSGEETAFVRECASQAHDDTAARLIGGLPRTT